MESVGTFQALTLNNRKELTVDGVSHIISFDSEYVSMETNMGRMSIEGKDLIIDNLSKSDSRISILGEIDAIYYSGERSKEKGFLARLLK